MWCSRRCPTRIRTQHLVLTTVLGLTVSTSAAALPTIYVLRPGNSLAQIGEHDAPASSTIDIIGLAAGETAVAIDVRPATGQLYILSSSSRLYSVFVASPNALATAVGPAFVPSLTGNRFAIDFDPVDDRLRVLSDTGQHLRLDPNTGAVAAVDTALDPATATLVGLAHDNNHAAAAGSRIYAIDSAFDRLMVESPSDSGQLVAVGPLGVDTSDVVGFDITANDGLGFATLTVGGTTGVYRIDLVTGGATLVQALTGPHVDLAVMTFGVPLVALRGGTELVRFYSATPGTILSTTTVRGLQAGETLVGIDENGRLYGVGSTSRLYSIDPTSGVATPIGSPFNPLLSGTAFGVEFDENQWLLRIVSDAGQSLQVDTQTGAVLQSGSFTGSVAEIGFLSGFDLTGQLLAIDVVGDRVVLCCGGSDPGTPLGVDATAAGGFDVSRGNRRGFAILTVGGVTSLYTIDVQSGAATSIGPLGGGGPINGLAAIPPETFAFAEGSTGAFWDTDLLIANTSPIPASVVVNYLTDTGRVVRDSLVLPPTSRRTIAADANTRLGATAFSSTITSPTGAPVVAERTMRWDASGYGMHTEKAVATVRTTWYFAEGAQGFYQTFFLLTNPSPSSVTATVRFLREQATEVTRTYSLAPNARLTIFAGAIPELVNHSFGTVVTFSSGEYPATGAAERAMYFGTPIFNGGHESAGVPEPATDWFLAEGATGSFFTTFVLLANPGSTPASVTLTYLREGGGSVVRTRTLAAGSRASINVALEDPSLAATSVATRVTSDTGIVVERSMYWPYDPASWQEAHNAFGVTGTALRWGLAEGRVGGPFAFQTFVLVANPGSTAANLTLTFLRTTGPPIARTATVAPGARLTISTGPGSMVPELADESFGAIVASDQPVFVERALYSNANDVLWAAGSSATATALP